MEAIRLSRDARGQLALHRPGAPDVCPVRLARCFPWTAPDDYLSVRDKEGAEVCLLTSREGLNAETRRLVDEELDGQEFFPRITRVVGVDDRFDVMVWTVETDRGPIELQVEHHEDIRLRDDGRVTIKDHGGGVFIVDDIGRLDPGSRRHIEDRLA
jgi:hypothetical protein